MVAGCATRGSGQPTNQTVRVETPEHLGARCELSNDAGRWVVESTPGSVLLVTSLQPLVVTCRAEAGATGGTGKPSKAGRTSGAGAVAGGVVGGAAMAAAAGSASMVFFPVLTVLAVATGATAGAMVGQMAEAHGQQLRYPDTIRVTLTGLTPSAADDAHRPALGLSVRSLATGELRERGLGERGAALVTRLADPGIARAAGLQAGDVVVAANGNEVADAADLERRVRALAPGVPLQLTVWRAGRVIEIVILRAGGAP
jgi:hypothetical protein